MGEELLQGQSSSSCKATGMANDGRGCWVNVKHWMAGNQRIQNICRDGRCHEGVAVASTNHMHCEHAWHQDNPGSRPQS